MKSQMAWLGRFAIYALIVGIILFALSCELYAMTWLRAPWAAACQVIHGPPPDNPFEMRIVPPTWTWPFYGALRSATFGIGDISPKMVGVAFFATTLLAPISLVFTNWSKTPARAWLSLLVAAAAFIGLGWTGGQAPTERSTAIGLACLTLYVFTLCVVFPLFARRTEPSPAAASD